MNKELMKTMTSALIPIFVAEVIMVLMITAFMQLNQIASSLPITYNSSLCLYTTTSKNWPYIQTPYVCNLNMTPNIWCSSGSGTDVPFFSPPLPPNNCTAAQSKLINTSNTTFTIND